MREHRQRTYEEARDALTRLINGAWHKPNAKACFSIPVDEAHDADVILSDVIHEWTTLKAFSATLKALSVVAAPAAQQATGAGDEVTRRDAV